MNVGLFHKKYDNIANKQCNVTDFVNFIKENVDKLFRVKYLKCEDSKVDNRPKSVSLSSSESSSGNECLSESEFTLENELVKDKNVNKVVNENPQMKNNSFILEDETYKRMVSELINYVVNHIPVTLEDIYSIEYYSFVHK